MRKVSDGTGQVPIHRLQRSDVDDICLDSKRAFLSDSFSLAIGRVFVLRLLASSGKVAKTYLLSLWLAISIQRWPRLRHLATVTIAYDQMQDDPSATSCNS